jgi:hypothetical protein
MNQILLLRVLLIVLFFTLPFVEIAPQSGLPIPMLKITAYPPGYPVDGQTWSIDVLGSQTNGQVWTPMTNATLLMIFSNGSEIAYHTNSSGQVLVQYYSELGQVTFQADATNYMNAYWTPVDRFVSNSTALFVIGLYGLGGPALFWSVLGDYWKSKKRKPIWDGVFAIALGAGIIGGILSFVWFVTWRFGSDWGFSNTIIAPIQYDPHLLYITIILLASTSLLALKTRILAHK